MLSCMPRGASLKPLALLAFFRGQPQRLFPRANDPASLAVSDSVPRFDPIIERPFKHHFKLGLRQARQQFATPQKARREARSQERRASVEWLAEPAGDVFASSELLKPAPGDLNLLGSFRYFHLGDLRLGQLMQPLWPRGSGLDGLTKLGRNPARRRR